MDKNIVKTFKEYSVQNEEMYAPDENGELVKQDYEFYKDFYPSKFKITNLEEDKDLQLYDCEEVWVLKYKDNIVATYSGTLGEDIIRKSVEILKNSEEGYENL